MFKKRSVRTIISVVAGFTLVALLYAVLSNINMNTQAIALVNNDSLTYNNIINTTNDEVNSGVLSTEDMNNTNIDDGDIAITAYPVNANQQTYGTFADAKSIGVLPDLIRAEATNGQTGYIYQTDYISSSRQAKNPEEARAIMEEYQQNEDRAFTEYILENVGISVNAKNLDDLIADINNTSGIECDWTGLAVNQQTALVDLLPESSRSTDIVREAYDKAVEANYVSVPVYALDGTTVIGEMIVQ